MSGPKTDDLVGGVIFTPPGQNISNMDPGQYRVKGYFQPKHAIFGFFDLNGIFLTLTPQFRNFRPKWGIFDLNIPNSGFSPLMGHFRPKHPNFGIFALNGAIST